MAKPVGFVILTLALFSYVPVPFSQAQDFERIAPKVPAKQETPVVLPKISLNEADGDDHVLVSKLKGMVFVNDKSLVVKEASTGISWIRVEGLDLLNSVDFQREALRHIGQSVSMKSLNQITKDVVQYYRNNGLPIVDVSIPEGQDITSGVVQFVVLEARLGKVKVEGNRWTDSRQITREIRLRTGELVREDQLLSDLNWINRNPFRQVAPVLTRGEKVGQTDLLLKTADRFPVRFYAGYEDSGNDLTGDERMQMGFNWGNAFNLDHQLNYQYTSDLHMNKLRAHSGSYVIPLPWRHTLNFFGSYAETKGDFASTLFNLNGFSWQASARYTVPLPSFGKYSHEVAGGYDFKQSNNNLEFGGANVFNTTTEVSQFTLGYTGQLVDEWGRTSISPSFFWSPGRMSPRNRDSFFVGSRAFSSAEYTYARLSVDRITKLPWKFSWLARGLAQISDSNLLGSEQMGIGGYSSVRGYDEREANGDQGYFFSTEIRTPPVSFAHLAGLEKIKDEFQFLGFFDYGMVENYRLLPGEDPHKLLASAGPGIRWNVSPYVSLRFDYGFQLYDTAANSRYNSRGHVGVVVSY